MVSMDQGPSLPPFSQYSIVQRQLTSGCRDVPPHGNHRNSRCYAREKDICRLEWLWPPQLRNCWNRPQPMVRIGKQSELTRPKLSYIVRDAGGPHFRSKIWCARDPNEYKLGVVAVQGIEAAWHVTTLFVKAGPTNPWYLLSNMKQPLALGYIWSFIWGMKKGMETTSRMHSTEEKDNIHCLVDGVKWFPLTNNQTHPNTSTSLRWTDESLHQWKNRTWHMTIDYIVLFLLLLLLNDHFYVVIVTIASWLVSACATTAGSSPFMRSQLPSKCCQQHWTCDRTWEAYDQRISTAWSMWSWWSLTATSLNPMCPLLAPKRERRKRMGQLLAWWSESGQWQVGLLKINMAHKVLICDCVPRTPIWMPGLPPGG